MEKPSCSKKSITLYKHEFIIIVYATDLLKIVFDNLEEDIELRSNIIVPPPLCASYEHPSKDEAINKHQSRFNNL